MNMKSDGPRKTRIVVQEQEWSADRHRVLVIHGGHLMLEVWEGDQLKGRTHLPDCETRDVWELIKALDYRVMEMLNAHN